MDNILDYFPYDKPRPSQLTVLRWLEANWDKYDVFVLQCPVAAGKSGLAVTIGNWANKMSGYRCSITTPDNVLVGQYRQDFGLPTMPLRRAFASGDLYQKARIDFVNKPIKVMNNYTLLANRAYGEVQIMDEAHQLIPMLQDMEGVKVWNHLEPYPPQVRTVADVLMWAARRGCEDPLSKKLTRLLSRNPDDYTVVHENENYRGRVRACLRVYPLTPKNNRPILWPPSKISKLIMMSATIGKPDIEDLGLHRRRVGYIEVPSDIPRANRPVIYKGLGSMGQHGISDNLPKLVDTLIDMHETHGGRGFIHTTYDIASRLPESYRWIKHNQVDKKAKLNAWLEDKSDRRSFIGCGLTTGLNLKGDICQWQVITKCQFPDLGDPAVMAKAAQSPEWYAWTTVKQIIQAYGRVCRSPDDLGKTYIVDSDFVRLYSEYKKLFPAWFRESLEI